MAYLRLTRKLLDRVPSNVSIAIHGTTFEELGKQQWYQGTAFILDAESRRLPVRALNKLIKQSLKEALSTALTRERQGQGRPVVLVYRSARVSKPDFPNHDRLPEGIFQVIDEESLHRLTLSDWSKHARLLTREAMQKFLLHLQDAYRAA